MVSFFISCVFTSLHRCQHPSLSTDDNSIAPRFDSLVSVGWGKPLQQSNLWSLDWKDSYKCIVPKYAWLNGYDVDFDVNNNNIDSIIWKSALIIQVSKIFWTLLNLLIDLLSFWWVWWQHSFINVTMGKMILAIHTLNKGLNNISGPLWAADEKPRWLFPWSKHLASSTSLLASTSWSTLSLFFWIHRFIITFIEGSLQWSLFMKAKFV